jgi:hypothetical protein
VLVDATGVAGHIIPTELAIDPSGALWRLPDSEVSPLCAAPAGGTGFDSIGWINSQFLWYLSSMASIGPVKML